MNENGQRTQSRAGRRRRMNPQKAGKVYLASKGIPSLDILVNSATL